MEDVGFVNTVPVIGGRRAMQSAAGELIVMRSLKVHVCACVCSCVLTRALQDSHAHNLLKMKAPGRLWMVERREDSLNQPSVGEPRSLRDSFCFLIRLNLRVGIYLK